MTDDEFERQIRSHYRSIDPGPAPQWLADRIADMLVPVPPRLVSSGWLRTLLAVTATAIVVVGLVLGPRLYGVLSGQQPSREPATPQPTPTATPRPSSAPSAAAIDAAGTIRSGGLWAVQGSTLLTSTDAGATWQHSPIPVASGYAVTAFVLDPDHAWSITPGAGSTPFNGAPTDVLHLVAHRTTDGGKTWHDANVPGNFAGTSQSVVFIDQDNGYLICSAMRHSSGVSTVLRTVDGGQIWFVVGTGSWLGSMFTVSGASTLWAGAEQEAGPVGHPLLDVSRDGGRTWSDASLPGLEGQTGGGTLWLPGPPAFADALHGFVAVVLTNPDGSPETRIYRTGDGGRSWSLVRTFAEQAVGGLAVADADHVFIPLTGLTATDNGGASWQTIATRGLPSGVDITWLGFVDALHGAAQAGGLYVSRDGGRSWQPAAFGLVP